MRGAWALIVAIVGSAALFAAPARAARLSDEHLQSRWAYPERFGWARAAPATSAHRVAPLRALTEDGRPELYLALREEAGWVEIRLPQRPNGTTGWVPRDYLGNFHIVTTALEIDRERLRMRLFEAGRVVWSARIGVGAPATPTPAGRFYVREKLRNRGGDPLYGPWAIGTSAYSRLTDWPGGGVVGIHGTDRPDLIPGRPSHGCVRLANRDVTALVRRLPLGTPIWVH